MGDVIPLRPARRAIDWRYVREQLSCSRSVAYEHLQRCAAEAGLPREAGALLRIDEATWLAYYLSHAIRSQRGRARAVARIERTMRAGLPCAPYRALVAKGACDLSAAIARGYRQSTQRTLRNVRGGVD